MTPILIAAAVIVVIVRQFQARALSPGTLVALPLVLVGLGADHLVAAPPRGGAAWIELTVEAVAAIVLGVARGRSVRVWRAPDGSWWRKGTLATAGLWAASIACRAALVAAAKLTGAHLGDTGAVIALIFGLSLGAQYLAMALRTDLVAGLAAPAAE